MTAYVFSKYTVGYESLLMAEFVVLFGLKVFHPEVFVQ